MFSVLISLLICPAALADAPRPDGEAELMDKHPLSIEDSYYKPGTGLVLQSEDGLFSLAPRLRIQYRYTFADEGPTGGEDPDPTQLLELRRARIQFKGHMFSEDVRFKAEFAFSPADVGMKGSPPSTSPLLDFYVDFTRFQNATLRVGQYKIPHNRQRVISSGDLQLVDRSIVNSEFTLDRDIGLDLRSKDLFGWNKLRYYAGVYAGQGRNDRSASDFGMTYLARVELLPFGLFNDYKEADFERSGPRLSLGGGYALALHAPRDQGVRGDVPADGGTTDLTSLTWDAMFKLAGFSLYTEWIYRTGERNPGDAVEVAEDGTEIPATVEDPRDGLGWMVQAGYLLPATRWEIAGRAGQVTAVGDSSSITEGSEYGGGLSYYFAQHPLKLQGDYFLLSEQDPGAEALTERRMRVQLQVAF